MKELYEQIDQLQAEVNKLTALFDNEHALRYVADAKAKQFEQAYTSLTSEYKDSEARLASYKKQFAKLMEEADALGAKALHFENLNKSLHAEIDGANQKLRNVLGTSKADLLENADLVASIVQNCKIVGDAKPYEIGRWRIVESRKAVAGYGAEYILSSEAPIGTRFEVVCPEGAVRVAGSGGMYGVLYKGRITCAHVFGRGEHLVLTRVEQGWEVKPFEETPKIVPPPPVQRFVTHAMTVIADGTVCYGLAENCSLNTTFDITAGNIDTHVVTCAEVPFAGPTDTLVSHLVKKGERFVFTRQSKSWHVAKKTT